MRSIQAAVRLDACRDEEIGTYKLYESICSHRCMLLILLHSRGRLVALGSSHSISNKHLNSERLPIDDITSEIKRFLLAFSRVSMLSAYVNWKFLIIVILAYSPQRAQRSNGNQCDEVGMFQCLNGLTLNFSGGGRSTTLCSLLRLECPEAAIFLTYTIYSRRQTTV